MHATLAALHYRDPLDRLVRAFKFHGVLAHADLFAALLAERLADRARGRSDRPDVIVPIPLGKRRLRKRGYNQSLEIARALARRLGLSVEHRCLLRARETSPQSDLDSAGRAHNVRDAFRVGGTVAGRRIALLDDVMTTGATVREAARGLREAGAAYVEVWVVARAGY